MMGFYEIKTGHYYKCYAVVYGDNKRIPRNNKNSKKEVDSQYELEAFIRQNSCKNCR